MPNPNAETININLLDYELFHYHKQAQSSARHKIIPIDEHHHGQFGYGDYILIPVCRENIAMINSVRYLPYQYNPTELHPSRVRLHFKDKKIHQFTWRVHILDINRVIDNGDPYSVMKRVIMECGDMNCGDMNCGDMKRGDTKDKFVLLMVAGDGV